MSEKGQWKSYVLTKIKRQIIISSNNDAINQITAWKIFLPRKLKSSKWNSNRIFMVKRKNWLMCRFILSVLMVNSGESQWLIRTNENVRFVYVCVRNISNRDYLSLCGKEANECSYSVLTNSFVTDSNPEFDSVFDSRQYFSYWIEPFFFCQIQNFSFSSMKTKANRTLDDISDRRFWINGPEVPDNFIPRLNSSISFLIERQKSFQGHILPPDRNPLWNQEMGKLHLVQNLKMNAFWLIHFQ